MCAHFPKRYSKKKNATLECRCHACSFFLLTGPHPNAVVLRGLRKVLIVQLGRCQSRESKWFWQTRGKIDASFVQANSQARPTRTTACPCADSQHYTLPPAAEKCTAQATLIDWFWDVRRFVYHLFINISLLQTCIYILLMFIHSNYLDLYAKNIIIICIHIS